MLVGDLSGSDKLKIPEVEYVQITAASSQRLSSNEVDENSSVIVIETTPN